MKIAKWLEDKNGDGTTFTEVEKFITSLSLRDRYVNNP